MLLHLLKYIKDIFGVTIGKWKTNPAVINLKPDANPPSSRYYTVTYMNKETSWKENSRIVEIGVLTLVQHSEYDTPVFIIVNKEGTVRFLTDFRKVNNIFFRKPYPIP